MFTFKKKKKSLDIINDFININIKYKCTFPPSLFSFLFFFVIVKL